MRMNRHLGLPSGQQARDRLARSHSPHAVARGSPCAQLSVLGFMVFIAAALARLLPLLIVAAGCSDGDTAAYSSIAIGQQGNAVAMIKSTKTGSAVLVFSRDATTRPRELAIPDVPIGVAFSHTADQLIVSTASADRRTSSTHWRQLIEFSIRENKVIRQIDSSPEALSSAIATDAGSFVYLRGIDRGLSGRPSAIWVLRESDGSVKPLSETEYGYRFAPSFIQGLGLIFMYVSEESARSKKTLVLVPFRRESQLPKWISEAVGETTESFGCDRAGVVCYRVNRSSARHGSFEHRLDVLAVDRQCRLDIEYDWVETISISTDGSTLAAVVAKSPRNADSIAKARLLILDLGKNKCRPSVVEHLLL